MHKEKPIVYVCSPYRGSTENYIKAQQYAAYVFSKGNIPIIPHTMYHGVLNDKNDTDRNNGLEAGKRLLKFCNEIWVFVLKGNETEGMIGEIEVAAEIGIPVIYVDKEQLIRINKQNISASVCFEHHKQTFNNIPRIAKEDITEFIKKGFDSELICMAIDIADLNTARWPYAKSILKRCERQKIFTLEQFENEPKKRTKKADSYAGFAAYDLEEFERSILEE